MGINTHPPRVAVLASKHRHSWCTPPQQAHTPGCAGAGVACPAVAQAAVHPQGSPPTPVDTQVRTCTHTSSSSTSTSISSRQTASGLFDHQHADHPDSAKPSRTPCPHCSACRPCAPAHRRHQAHLQPLLPRLQAPLFAEQRHGRAAHQQQRVALTQLVHGQGQEGVTGQVAVLQCACGVVGVGGGGCVGGRGGQEAGRCGHAAELAEMRSQSAAWCRVCRQL